MDVPAAASVAAAALNVAAVPMTVVSAAFLTAVDNPEKLVVVAIVAATTAAVAIVGVAPVEVVVVAAAALLAAVCVAPANPVRYPCVTQNVLFQIKKHTHLKTLRQMQNTKQFLDVHSCKANDYSNNVH